MPTASELRERFLALRASGEPLPRPAASLSSLCVDHHGGRLVKVCEPARYLDGATPREKLVSLFAELEGLEGWTVARSDSSDVPHAIEHTDGRSISIRCAWNSGAKASFFAGAPRSPADGYLWTYQLDQKMTEEGGSREIGISLDRSVDSILGDLSRRLMGPYASAWPEVSELAATHESETREAHALGAEIANACDGCDAHDETLKDGARGKTDFYFRGGSVRIYPGHNGSAPRVSFERLTVDADQARAIAAIVNGQGGFGDA